MRWLLILLLLFSFGGTAAYAQFPYEAVVDVDGTYVHSGPGKKYYPTQQLNKGDRVVVHSEDWGGWFKITPPPGSYSWVRAEYVRPTAPNRGQLTESNVVAYVGSSINDIRQVMQVQLSKGDVVEILGEQTFESESGPVRMFKIKPPKGEYRWIPGKAVVSAQIAQQRQSQSTPVLTRSAPVVEPTPPKKPVPEIVERPLVRTQGSAAIQRTGPTAEELQTDRLALQQLDDQFRAMIEQEPPQWNLAELEQGYLRLQQHASHPAFRSQVDLRLDALKRYARIKQEHEEFYRLVTEARQRDAQLLSLQQQEQQKLQELRMTTAPATPRLEPQPEPSLPSASPEPQPTGPVQLQSPEVSAPAAGRPTPKFDGAGVIQKLAARSPGPRYVLTTPSGRVLAYLHAPANIDLDRYVGQSMGIYGQRSYRPELLADLLIIREMVPVRLKTP